MKKSLYLICYLAFIVFFLTNFSPIASTHSNSPEILSKSTHLTSHPNIFTFVNSTVNSSYSQDSSSYSTSTNPLIFALIGFAFLFFIALFFPGRKHTSSESNDYLLDEITYSTFWSSNFSVLLQEYDNFSNETIHSTQSNTKIYIHPHPFCPLCGTLSDSDAFFCENCGNRLA